MPLNITPGTWLAIEQLEGMYSVVAMSEKPGSSVKTQKEILSGGFNPEDAVLCSFAPNMFDCLETCSAILSKIADTDETVAKCYRYIDSVLAQIEPARNTPF